MNRLNASDGQRMIMSKNLTRFAAEKGMNATEVARKLNLPETTVRSWFNGDKYPRLENIQILADYFEIPRSALTEENSDTAQRFVPLARIPILSTMAKYNPLLAEENIEGYVDEVLETLPQGELFYVQTSDDSMSPHLSPDSYVLVREQSEIEKGKIAAVRLNGNGEIILRRVWYQDNLVMLIPDNSVYPPYIINEDCPATIIGTALKVTTVLK